MANLKLSPRSASQDQPQTVVAPRATSTIVNTQQPVRVTSSTPFKQLSCVATLEFVLNHAVSLISTLGVTLTRSLLWVRCFKFAHLPSDRRWKIV